MKSDKLISAVEGVTRKWAKQRKAEERQASARQNREIAMFHRPHISIRDAAWWAMEAAYMKASANDTLPANARQVMYAARPYIEQRSNKPLGSRFDQYFTQQLLPDYIEERGVDWDVVYDDRGHFREPHDEHPIGLGTLSVRDYLASICNHQPIGGLNLMLAGAAFSTRGPRHRFGAILFIEKEGFMPLFEAVKLAERFDLAIMSTKGVSVTAARHLVDELCGEHEIPLLVLHDFDKSGFTIVGTLQRDTRRYSFENAIEVVDLGLRLEDIDGLQSESVYNRGSDDAVRSNLIENGATEDEVEFLLDRRVELNAMTSPQLIEFIERKLRAVGVAKILPDQETLEKAYRRTRLLDLMSERIEDLRTEVEEKADAEALPADLALQIEALLVEHPELGWDAALRRISRRS